MTDRTRGDRNFRGETIEQARQQLVWALKASKSWVTAYAEAYLDDFSLMSAAAACDVCKLPRPVEGVAGNPMEHCACARLINQTSEGGVVCPACEKAGALPVRYSSTIVPTSGSSSFTAHRLEGDHCPHCGEIFVDADKARRNEIRYDEARAAANLAG